MPTYIGLIDYTGPGIAKMDDSPKRLQEARDHAESKGGEIGDFFLTLGRYDAVYIAEFPDDESYTQWAIDVAAQGAVSTETLKAFPEDEYLDVIEGLGGAPGGPIGEIY